MLTAAAARARVCVYVSQEVQQPTVVDAASFLVWAEEAFHLWISEWASIYDCDSGSADIIHKIHDTHFLVNLVDHDFVG
jgi:methylenetetrahydrofolate reductase (NADPH)